MKHWILIVATLAGCTLDSTTHPHPEPRAADATAAELDRAAPRPEIARLEPPDGCFNIGDHFTIVGHHIHPDADVRVAYPYHDATARPAYDGDGFAMAPDLVWDGMARSVSGWYTVQVRNPDGYSSAPVPLYLRWCAE